jgi:cardiolipin synthase
MDPLADKALVNSLATSLCFVGILPVPLVGVWLLKDTILISCTLFVVAKNQREDSLANKASSFWYPASPLKVEPTTISKVNTVLQFGTLGIAMVHPLYPMTEALHALW